MRGENVISIFSGQRSRPARPIETLRPIGANVRLGLDLRLEVYDTTGTSYASLPFWKRRQADYLKSIVLDFTGAGRRDAARGHIRRPDIHICPRSPDGTQHYEIVLGDDINRRIPAGRRLCRRSLETLRVARLAYETGVTNLDTGTDGSVYFLNRRT